MIGKIPKPKGGWTPGDYKYLGPYNPFDKQLKYDPETGEVLKWNVKPKNKVDEIAAMIEELIKVIVIEEWLNL